MLKLSACPAAASVPQLLAERPLAIIQIVLAITALELTAGAQDYENKAPGEIGRYVRVGHTEKHS